MIAEKLCERCGYDEADCEAQIPDIWVDRFLAICAVCARKGHLLQARRDEG